MIRQYRKQWLRWHKSYEKEARILLQRKFKEIALNIPYDLIKEDNYKIYTSFYITEQQFLDVYKDIYTRIGVKHGLRVGNQINKQINQKDFTIDNFTSQYIKDLSQWLINNGGQRISLVRETYIEYINQIIAKGFSDGLTTQQMSSQIYKLIKSRNFYRWQALRIARTETTTAANYSATVSGTVSGVEMDKVWISGQDVRTRRPPEDKFDHYEMNGKRVKLEDNFIVSGEEMMYPADPKGSAGNVINCRCAVAQVVRKDKDGNIVRK